MVFVGRNTSIQREAEQMDDVLHDCYKAPHSHKDLQIYMDLPFWDHDSYPKNSSMIHLPVAPFVLVESQSIGLPNGCSPTAQVNRRIGSAGATQ